MRMTTALMASTLLILPACKDDTTVSGNYQEIGRFTVTIDGEQRDFVSYLNTKTGSSGITRIPASSLTVWLLSGYAGVQDGSPALPELSVSLIQTGDTLMLDDVELITDTDYRHYRANTETGKQTLVNAAISDDGKIGFGITADMLLFKLDDNGVIPVEGAAPVHIDGTYSATMPKPQEN